MNQKTEKFWRNSRQYLREYNEVTGIHGLRYITEKRSKTEKILWVIIVLVSLAGCVYMICEVIQKYQSSPVVVSFATEPTPIYQIPFPAITICPEAKYSSMKFNYTDIYFKILQAKTETINKTELQYYNYINLLCDSEEWIYCKNGTETVDSDFFHIIEKLAPEMTLECWMGYTLYNCTEVFTPIIIDEGICYSFNILDRTRIFRDNVQRYKHFYHVDNDLYHYHAEFGYDASADIETYPRRALFSGAANSLDIYLKYNSNDTDYICSNFLQGFRILIHNPWDVPHLSSHFFRVPLDKIIVAAVDPQLTITSEAVKKFRPDKRKCYLIDERPLKYFKVYTQSNCIFECMTNYTLHKCGCVHYYMPREKSTAICGIASHNCTKRAENELKLRDLRNKISDDENYCDCKPDCTTLKYHVENSQSDFYWREYFKIRRNYNLKDVSENNEQTHWSILSIYIKDEQAITLERNELYGICDLISNFGGLLGLFTGFSLISLAEVIYFLSLRIFCNRRLYGNWSGLPN